MSAQPIRPEPFRIEPKFVERIWGMRSLAPLFPEKTNLPAPIGEVWLTGVDCKIATGPFAGKTLGEAWREMPPEWRGTRFTKAGDFPLLIKFIFPNDKLSIQVHPDDAYASVHERAAGGRGKTEMWHIISAEAGAKVLIGLKAGVDRKRFLDRLEHNNVEDLFEALPVRRGDTFFVPAGTPHTIGPRIVICEIQEYSDLTYRVYDYGRVDSQGKPRELHVEKALEVMNFGSRVNPRVKDLPLPSHDAFKFLLAACRFFAAETWGFEWQVSSQIGSTNFEMLMFLSGSGVLNWQHGEQRYQRSDCWLIPASLGQFELKPAENTQLARTYVPDLSALREELSREGIPEASVARVLFE